VIDCAIRDIFYGNTASIRDVMKLIQKRFRVLAVNLSMQSRQGFDKADFQLAMLRP
jgi:hypothetical protein